MSRKPQQKSGSATTRDLGAELLESVRQMKAGRAAKTHHIDIARGQAASEATDIQARNQPEGSNVS